MSRLTSAVDMARSRQVDPKRFRAALRRAKLGWHSPNGRWEAWVGSPEHLDMERVLDAISRNHLIEGASPSRILSLSEQVGAERAVLAGRKNSVDEPPKESFPAVVNRNTRVLILGSLPGDLSLQWGQYYANPRNQFWPLIAAVIGRGLPDAYQARLALLSDAGVGLWDVIKSARRPGSLDARIRDHTPNPLAKLVAELPSLRAIAFNGDKPSKIGRPQIHDCGRLVIIDLPSSSSARAIPFERKLASWMSIRDYL